MDAVQGRDLRTQIDFRRILGAQNASDVDLAEERVQIANEAVQVAGHSTSDAGNGLVHEVSNLLNHLDLSLQASGDSQGYQADVCRSEKVDDECDDLLNPSKSEHEHLSQSVHSLANPVRCE